MGRDVLDIATRATEFVAVTAVATYDLDSSRVGNERESVQRAAGGVARAAVASAADERDVTAGVEDLHVAEGTARAADGRGRGGRAAIAGGDRGVAQVGQHFEAGDVAARAARAGGGFAAEAREH